MLTKILMVVLFVLVCTFTVLLVIPSSVYVGVTELKVTPPPPTPDPRPYPIADPPDLPCEMETGPVEAKRPDPLHYSDKFWDAEGVAVETIDRFGNPMTRRSRIDELMYAVDELNERVKQLENKE